MKTRAFFSLLAFCALGIFSLSCARVSAQVMKPLGEMPLAGNGSDFAELFPFTLEKGLPENITNVRTWGSSPGEIDPGDALTIRQDRFIRAGKPFYYLGTNICGMGAFPPKEEAENIAQTLARFGFSVIRLHHMDTGYIWGKNSDRTLTEIDAELLDRLDYFIAQLEKYGIYVNLNLHVGRKLDKRDGFENDETIPIMSKGLDIFEPRMIELAEKYARDLLTHVNPYTRRAYTEDPGVAMIEINNENSTVASWFQLHFEPMGPPYSDIFRDCWNKWLLAKYPTSAELKTAWGDAADVLEPDALAKGTVPVLSRLGTGPLPMTPPVFIDFLTFLVDLETRYWRRLEAFIKNDLKAAAPVSGTQLLFGSWYAQSEMDYCDEHAYWNHPIFPATLPPHSTWDSSDWYIDTKAQVNDRFGGTLSRLAVNRIFGRPLTVSEYDHPGPNFYAAEGLPMLAAVGAFQNWTGIHQFCWSGDYAQNRYTSFFAGLCADPAKLVHLPACWSLFVRGDVQRGPGQYIHKLPMSKAGEIETAARLIHATTLDEFMNVLRDGSDIALAVYSGIELTDSPELSNAAPSAPVPVNSWSELPEELGSPDQGHVTNEFGELTWNFGPDQVGFFTVDTPGTKLLTGFVQGREFSLQGVTFTPGKTRLDWTTVSMTLAADDSPVPANRDSQAVLPPGRYLLAATGLQTAQGAKYIDLGEGQITSAPIYGGNEGTQPALCEGIAMNVAINGYPPEKIAASALDEAGNPKEALQISATETGSAFELDPKYQTLWYEVQITP